ncbi:MAG: hypothetical protein ABEJ94_05570 [Halorientalis sp.]
MLASVAAELSSRLGPFLVPIVLFALGVAAYALLWLFYRWRDGAHGDDSIPEE